MKADLVATLTPAADVARLWPVGVLRVPIGTCPGCARDSHPGRTCNGRTTDQVIRMVWPDQRLVAPADDPR